MLLSPTNKQTAIDIFQASGSWDKSIRLWHPVTGKVLHVFEGHRGWIQAVAFSADSLCLASASEDETVRVWDVVKGHCIKVLEVSIKLFIKYVRKLNYCLCFRMISHDEFVEEMWSLFILDNLLLRFLNIKFMFV